MTTTQLFLRFLITHMLESLYENPLAFEIPRRQPPKALAFFNVEDAAYNARDVADGQGAEHVAYQMSWSVWNDQPSLPHKSPNLWETMQSWKSLGPAEKGISLRYSRYWLTFDAAKDWLGIYDICQEALQL
ncbi:hypothetical protein EI94DRAFT_1821921 [Lactarius quietus]|nr:hypothetical protein EI94DRAFT_1821921 [Lactarius quietus]